MRRPELFFDFPARFEIQVLERIDRMFSPRVIGYPGAHAVDLQQELADAPILGVHDASGNAWIGVFYGGTSGPPLAIPSRVVGMPDGVSFCVVNCGAGTIVRSDDPTAETPIDIEPISDVLVLPEQELVIVAGAYSSVSAYGVDGFLWQADGVVTDDVEIVGVEGGALHVIGFEAGVHRAGFAVDLATGVATPLS